MQKMQAFANPEAFVAALSGWRRELVELLRAGVRGVGSLEETIKWGNLVYLSGGPVLMIRAEPERVLFGFWRGQRLLEIEPRLKPGGKYEMATLELRKGMTIAPATIRRLTLEAIALNRKAGDPQRDAKPRAASSRVAKPRTAKPRAAKPRAAKPRAANPRAAKSRTATLARRGKSVSRSRAGGTRRPGEPGRPPDASCYRVTTPRTEIVRPACERRTA
jgi:hypothetical protein